MCQWRVRRGPPGPLASLAVCKEQGDVLVISITADMHISRGNTAPMFHRTCGRSISCIRIVRFRAYRQERNTHSEHRRCCSRISSPRATIHRPRGHCHDADQRRLFQDFSRDQSLTKLKRNPRDRGALRAAVDQSYATSPRRAGRTTGSHRRSPLENLQLATGTRSSSSPGLFPGQGFVGLKKLRRKPSIGSPASR